MTGAWRPPILAAMASWWLLYAVMTMGGIAIVLIFQRR